MKKFNLFWLLAPAVVSACGPATTLERHSACDTVPPRGYTLVSAVEKARLLETVSTVTSEVNSRQAKRDADPNGRERVRHPVPDWYQPHLRKIETWVGSGCPGGPDSALKAHKRRFDGVDTLSMEVASTFRAALINEDNERFSFWWVSTLNDDWFDFTVAIDKTSNDLRVVEMLDWSYMDR